MNINPINNNQYKQKTTGFGHGNPWSESTYSTAEKVIVASTTALGIAGALALLAKQAKYSLKPNKMFKNLKNTYVWKAPYGDEKPILTIGAGSCLGGLAGGYLIDHDKNNRIAKLKETLLQVANISLPAVFTVRFAKLGEYFGKKYLEKNKKKTTIKTNGPKAISAITGLVVGVYVSNIVANKINEKIFNKGKGRPVQISDFSAHLDDFCIAGEQISKTNPIIKSLTRCIPLALMVPGNEIGNKKLD